MDPGPREDRAVREMGKALFPARSVRKSCGIVAMPMAAAGCPGELQASLIEGEGVQGLKRVFVNIVEGSTEGTDLSAHHSSNI